MPARGSSPNRLPIPISRCQTARTYSFPGRIFCARVFASLLRSPRSRGGRSAERRSGVCETPVGRAVTRHVRRLRGALRPHDAGRSPLGAPPKRFWASGAALLSPAFAPDRSQRAPRTQVVVPGGRGPCLPRRTVTCRPCRTPLPAPPSGSSPETPLKERGWESSMASRCSQEINTICSP